jgi:hypothetical protein
LGDSDSKIRTKPEKSESTGRKKYCGTLSDCSSWKIRLPIPYHSSKFKNVKNKTRNHVRNVEYNFMNLRISNRIRIAMQSQSGKAYKKRELYGNYGGNQQKEPRNPNAFEEHYQHYAERRKQDDLFPKNHVIRESGGSMRGSTVVFHLSAVFWVTRIFKSCI